MTTTIKVWEIKCREIDFINAYKSTYGQETFTSMQSNYITLVVCLSYVHHSVKLS